MKMKSTVILVIEQSGMRNDEHFTLGLQVLDSTSVIWVSDKE